jgi:hypothetical protein
MGAAFFEKRERERENHPTLVTTSVFNYLLPEYKL